MVKREGRETSLPPDNKNAQLLLLHLLHSAAGANEIGTCHGLYPVSILPLRWQILTQHDTQ